MPSEKEQEEVGVTIFVYNSNRSEIHKVISEIYNVLAGNDDELLNSDKEYYPTSHRRWAEAFGMQPKKEVNFKRISSKEKADDNLSSNVSMVPKQSIEREPLPTKLHGLESRN